MFNPKFRITLNMLIFRSTKLRIHSKSADCTASREEKKLFSETYAPDNAT